MFNVAFAFPAQKKWEAAYKTLRAGLLLCCVCSASYTTALTTKITSGMVTRKMPMTSMMEPARIIVVMGV